ncbi:MAG: hypothetical protein F6J95_014740 [Leptolyngbya sp. SIO1E4]|nr:hypothetical protein [Leptolyngbya sp. SIO1E4]
MASSPRRRRRRPRRSQFRWQIPKPAEDSTGTPIGWMCLTGILYAAAGIILASFPTPYWIWIMALGGALAQALALAGPQALRRFRVWAAHGLVSLAILGTGAIVAALSAALNYVGTDNLDQITPGEVAFEVFWISVIALVVAALGAIVSAETGDRLLKTFNRLQTTLVLAATCILGLALGGFMGLLVV